LKKRAGTALAALIFLAAPVQASQINLQCTDEKGEYSISATNETGTLDKPFTAYLTINLNSLTATGAGLSWTVQTQPEVIILSSGNFAAGEKSQTYRIDRKNLKFSRLELSRNPVLGLWKAEASGTCKKITPAKGNLI
jgi:hypothetical protein